MRKNRRLHDYFTVLAPSAPSWGDKASPSNTSTNSSLVSSSPHYSQSGSATIDNPPLFREHFSTSIAFVLVALLSVVFFTGFFSIYLRRFVSEEDTAGRRGTQNGRMRSRASQGLDRSVIEALPLFKYSLLKGLKQGKQALECVVCLSEFEERETLRLLPECGHAFHPDCIDMWLFSHCTCPLCRTSLVPVVGEENRRTRGRNEMVGIPRPGQSMGYEVTPLQNQSQIFSPSHSENLSLVAVGVNPLTPF